MPRERRYLVTAPEMVATSYRSACAWPGNSIFLWRRFCSMTPNSSPPPMAIISSVAVYLPLFLMMPPTRPVPSSISVLSSRVTSAPSFFASIAAAHPDQPPPAITIFFMTVISFLSFSNTVLLLSSVTFFRRPTVFPFKTTIIFFSSFVNTLLEHWRKLAEIFLFFALIIDFPSVLCYLLL